MSIHNAIHNLSSYTTTTNRNNISFLFGRVVHNHNYKSNFLSSLSLTLDLYLYLYMSGLFVPVCVYLYPPSKMCNLTLTDRSRSHNGNFLATTSTTSLHQRLDAWIDCNGIQAHTHTHSTLSQSPYINYIYIK